MQCRAREERPGRKTDLLDAEWLVHLLECGLLRGWLIPPADIKAARDVIRYRRKLVEHRTSKLQRLGNVLQDAGIKADSVASSVTPKSVRAMVEALIDGERRPAVLADLARGSMRSKIPDLQRALEGRFDDHHALMCRLHLAHLDQLDAMIGALDEQIEQLMHPFCARRELIASIPGIGVGASATVISEIGADPAAWFPSAEHLASWVRLCPGNHESAGKRHHGARRTGNQHLQPVLVECAWAAVRTDGYLREYYRRQVRKFGGFRSPAANKKAITTVAHKLIVIIWHVLATGRPHQDLGADYFTTRMDPDKERRRLVAKLEAQGLGSPSNLPPETPTYTLSPTDPASLQSPAGHACRGHPNSRTSPQIRPVSGAFATAHRLLWNTNQRISIGQLSTLVVNTSRPRIQSAYQLVGGQAPGGRCVFS